jgi:hypothetical protein
MRHLQALEEVKGMLQIGSPVVKQAWRKALPSISEFRRRSIEADNNHLLHNLKQILYTKHKQPSVPRIHRSCRRMGDWLRTRDNAKVYWAIVNARPMVMATKELRKRAASLSQLAQLNRKFP